MNAEEKEKSTREALQKRIEWLEEHWKDSIRKREEAETTIQACKKMLDEQDLEIVNLKAKLYDMMTNH